VAGLSVCVGIPVKNGATYLAEAIESVLEQANAELTVHVVDNLSDDDSVRVAQRYASDARVRVDVNEQDVQYYGSLNRILSETLAEYFVPFAADDVMYPSNLERKLEAIQDTGAGFAHSTAQLIDNAGTVRGVWPDHRATPGVIDPPDFFSRIVPSNAVSCQSVVARTSALREIGGFDARSLYAGDWLTWLRLSLRWRVATLPDALIANRLHVESGTAVLGGSGISGRDLPATLDRVFLDAAMPPAWAVHRDGLVSAAYTQVAFALHNAGIRKVERGWAGYMAVGRALARTPDDPRVLEQYRVFVKAAGLVAPSLPLVAVAEPPRDAQDALALGATVDELGMLLGSVIVGVSPDRVDSAVELLKPVFGETATEIVLVPTLDVPALISPGRIALARWGSRFVARAEDRGVPVYPYAIPNPFDSPPDMARWQTVDCDACLP
jgi:glycosyltransferase involved in cell wall biosynthesis